MKKWLCLLLVLAMSLSLPVLAETAPAHGAGTLVLGINELNSVFSPFFSLTAYDTEIYKRVHESLLGLDRGGAPSDGLATYVTPEIIKDEATGEVKSSVYTFQLKDGVKFSDGTPVTADDVIFSMYVYLDPTYDGNLTLSATPIKGLEAYVYDDPDFAEKVAGAEAEAEKYKPETISKEDFIAYLIESKLAGWWEGRDSYDWYTYIKDEGFESTGKETDDELLALLAEIEYTNYASGYDPYSFYLAKLKAALKPDYATLTDIKVPTIEGIQKVDDRTVQVTVDGVDPTAIYNLSVYVAPKAYYGETFKKGDLSGVKAKNAVPVGAGPYKFVSFENNVVTLVANENYYKGCPKIPTIKYQVYATDTALFDAFMMGEIDIANPTATKENIARLEEGHKHIEYVLNDGWGYIGLNAKRIPDVNIRKGLMHMMLREPSIKSYYGDLAYVIERCMTAVSWAYPQDATEYYGYDPDRALEYFKAAGYEQVEENGQVKLMKDGEQMHIIAGIGSEDLDHPNTGILQNMKIQMEKIGAIFDLNGVSWATFSDGVTNDGWDIFVMAWGNGGQDPDMTQIWTTTGPTNHYHMANAEFDALNLQARRTLDVEERKALYAKCLDIIMDEAVCMPTYQRYNLFAFNPDVIDIATLPKEMSPFYDYFAEIENLELVK